MPNKNLIERKLSEVLKQLHYLNEFRKLSQDEIFGNYAKLYLLERILERLITAAIDINMHLISDLTVKAIPDYHNSFIELAYLGVFDSAFAKEIAPSASLRNILVHEYMELDKDKFYIGLQKTLETYPLYTAYIEKFLSKY